MRPDLLEDLRRWSEVLPADVRRKLRNRFAAEFVALREAPDTVVADLHAAAQELVVLQERTQDYADSVRCAWPPTAWGKVAYTAYNTGRDLVEWDALREDQQFRWECVAQAVLAARRER